MLITSLLPMLSRYSLGIDLVAGPDGLVTLTIIPRLADAAKGKAEAGEVRPISITATAAEIDAELARGAEGALGQLIASRKALGDQIAEQLQAADAAKGASTKPKAPTSKAVPVEPAKPPAPATTPVNADPGEPASLWD